MIKIQDKHLCCGCASCVQVCPKGCIAFDEDEQGFRYPLVDTMLCVDCGLCEKVCPVLCQSEASKPLKVYVAQNPNEAIRLKSSSGGVFSILAEAVIEQGGVVFGARFDVNWQVEHAYTETKEGLEAFRGSKYLQSRVGETFKQAREFLKSGRKVLYSGTSCQIAGLKKFLHKEYENLITIDVVCHGAPSPLVWRTYLDELAKCPNGIVGNQTVFHTLNGNSVITDVSFRDKSTGWKQYSMIFRGKSISKVDKHSFLYSANNVEKSDVLLHETFDQNFFMRMFLSNLCLRPSCFRCPAKCGKSGSDFTLADFWGIGNFSLKWDDDKGTSLVMIQSEKGLNFFKELPSVLYEEQTYENALFYNPSIEHSVSETKSVKLFWNAFHHKQFHLINKLISSSRLRIFWNRIKSVLLRKI